MATRFNPFDHEFTQNPYPTYEKLREEAAVARVRFGVSGVAKMALAGARMVAKNRSRILPAIKMMRARSQSRQSGSGPQHRPGLRSRIFTVSRYEEVSYVLRNANLFSSEIMGGSQADEMGPGGGISPTAGSLIGQDPPEHSRQRNILNRGFTPRRVTDQEPRIRDNAEELFAKFESTGQCDLMNDIANPLPVSVIADLLGLDPARRDDFKRWSTALIVGSTQPGDERLGRQNFDLFAEFRSYMTEVFEERRQNLGDDMISTLIQGGEDEGILDSQQVISFASLMLAAGSETTTNLIGNAMLALFHRPELLKRIQEEPKLISKLVEETLRYDSPIQLLARIATQDTKIGEVAIPKGSVVTVLLASANRDERKFDRPDEFDIDRVDTSHIAFGFGNHFCIGASLARMEGSIALELILTRLRNIELTVSPDAVTRHGSFLVRGPSSLPVRFDV